MINKTEQEIMKNWKGNTEQPLVSVCCITFNHENYIAEALDSFLMQETDFCFEVIVRDDASPDQTAEIIREYEAKYPNIIKPIYEKENGYQKGIKAFPVTFAKAKGEYIALCEGDDYWTDTKKLQIQKDFLEKNIEYSGCGHQVQVVSSLNINQKRVYRQGIKTVLNKNDFLRDCPFQTASFVFKANIIKKHPLPTNILSGDKAIMLLISRFGLVQYSDNVMSAYRLHEGGLSGNVTMNMMLKDLNLIPWILTIDLDFPKYQYKSYLHECIMLFPRDLKIFFFLKHFFLYIIYSFSFFPHNLRLLFNMFIRFNKVFIKRIYSKLNLKRK